SSPFVSTPQSRACRPVDNESPQARAISRWQLELVAAPKRRHRGQIRKLPSSSFQAIVRAGIDPLTRKRRYLWETAKTYGAAAEALTRPQSHVDQNRRPKSDIKVAQAIAHGSTQRDTRTPAARVTRT